MRKDIQERRSEIEQWIENNESKHFICTQLKCKQDTLNRYLNKLNITYKGNQGSKGKPNKKYKNSFEYANGTFVKSHKLRLKLIKDGIKKEQCETCGITEWCGKTVPLELDHIDGNHYNNEISNLRVICCNCHAQTETHSGKNKGKYCNK